MYGRYPKKKLLFECAIINTDKHFFFLNFNRKSILSPKTDPKTEMFKRKWRKIAGMVKQIMEFKYCFPFERLITIIWCEWIIEQQLQINQIHLSIEMRMILFVPKQNYIYPIKKKKCLTPICWYRLCCCAFLSSSNIIKSIKNYSFLFMIRVSPKHFISFAYVCTFLLLLLVSIFISQPIIMSAYLMLFSTDTFTWIIEFAFHTPNIHFHVIQFEHALIWQMFLRVWGEREWESGGERGGSRKLRKCVKPDILLLA